MNAQDIPDEFLMLSVPGLPCIHGTYGVLISRVGQNHIYTVSVRYFWQGVCQIYGHKRCKYSVLANPTQIL